VEALIIVFLVGIGTIAMVTIFGDNIRALFGASGQTLAGDLEVSNPGQAPGNTKWTMQGGTTDPYSTGSCGVTGCSTTGP
jgi:hypothetical protein